MRLTLRNKDNFGGQLIPLNSLTIGRSYVVLDMHIFADRGSYKIESEIDHNYWWVHSNNFKPNYIIY